MTAGSGLVETNGIDTYYDVRGSGPWVVMSNSLACDHSMWDDQVDVLSRHFRVLRYDVRGHGRSEAGDAPIRPATLVDDLCALLDRFAIEKAHFVGLSMGGLLGQELALARPEALVSLVLSDTSAKFPDGVRPEWERRIQLARAQGMDALVEPTLARWYTPEFKASRGDAMARFAHQIAATSIDGYAGCSLAILDFDTRDRLTAIQTPTLVVVGERDVGTPVDMARTLSDLIAGAQLRIIPDAAHFPNVEQPDAFNAAVLDFLRRQEAGRAI